MYGGLFMKRTDKYREEYEREQERERQSRNNYDINEENKRRFYEHQQRMYEEQKNKK
uniref:Uncharacterized protein n=1 Tax=Staphylococcus aureus TaxID=1280 RepID=E4PYF2_STAAU|nr:hypothetical protein SUM_0022p2 [Staphylococcus aureus]